jgi:hypothetical protein
MNLDNQVTPNQEHFSSCSIHILLMMVMSAAAERETAYVTDICVIQQERKVAERRTHIANRPTRGPGQERASPAACARPAGLLHLHHLPRQFNCFSGDVRHGHVRHCKQDAKGCSTKVYRDLLVL